MSDIQNTGPGVTTPATQNFLKGLTGPYIQGVPIRPVPWYAPLLNGKVQATLLAIATAAAGWFGHARTTPAAFDAKAYREAHALVLLGMEQKPGGVLWHIGRVGTNGPLDDLTLFVAAQQPPVTPPTAVAGVTNAPPK